MEPPTQPIGSQRTEHSEHWDATGRRIRAFARRIGEYFLADGYLPDGRLDERVVDRSYRRLVVAFTIASAALFAGSLPVVGVPTGLWPGFLVAVIVTSVVVAAALLVPRRGSVASAIAAGLAGAAILLLDSATGEYYHHAAPLYALVVVGVATMQGTRSAVVMVVIGAAAIPLATAVGERTLVDALYTIAYLSGIVAAVWMARRLQEHGAAALRVSERNYRDLVEQVPAVVYRAGFGVTGAWTYVSPSAERVVGIPADAILADPGLWWSRINPGDAAHVVADEVQALEHHADATTVEYRLTGDDGIERWISDEATVVLGPDGEPAYWSGVLTDVTERKELEATLRQANRIEAVGQLAGGIAHDFNNLLTAIRGYSELLRADLAEAGHGVEDADQLIATADRAAALTRQLLAFSRRQLLRPTVVEVGETVQLLAPMLRRLLGAHIELETRLTRSAHVLVDPSQLEQVIVNLAVNARDAMLEGGRLSIATAVVDETVQIVVADSGTGMDEATRSRIFEPFFTTKEIGKGTGMGLATVHGIVRQSSGTISCTSAPGRGTTFVIELPAVQPHVQDREAMGDDTPLGGSESILLVEDEEAIRLLATRLLRKLGYHVTAAASGTEALAVLGDRARSVDLLLTDIRMPGLQGTDLAAMASQVRPGIAVLVMSGYPGGAGANTGPHYLQKPFDSLALARAVRGALLAARQEPPPVGV